MAPEELQTGCPVCKYVYIHTHTYIHTHVHTCTYIHTQVIFPYYDHVHTHMPNNPKNIKRKNHKYQNKCRNDVGKIKNTTTTYKLYNERFMVKSKVN